MVESVICAVVRYLATGKGWQGARKSRLRAVSGRKTQELLPN